MDSIRQVPMRFGFWEDDSASPRLYISFPAVTPWKTPDLQLGDWSRLGCHGREMDRDGVEGEEVTRDRERERDRDEGKKKKKSETWV